MSKIGLEAIRRAARILRVIGHADRLRLVEELERGPRTVSELMRALRMDQVSVSKHLSVLKKEGIVDSRPSANFRTYSIRYRNVIHVLDCLRKNA